LRRAGRRPCVGWHALDWLPAGIFPASPRALAPVPSAVPRSAARRVRSRQLRFFGDLADLAEPSAFTRRLCELRRVAWVVYAKPPFGGPSQVLAYLGRYTHRVAIANSRLVRITDAEVGFRWKDYRHHGKSKVMTLSADEFIRRFLLHTLPDGFHRIRHYGFLANGRRAAKLELCRKLLDVRPPSPSAVPVDEAAIPFAFDRCPCCGGTMITLATLPRSPPRRTFSWNDSS